MYTVSYHTGRGRGERDMLEPDRMRAEPRRRRASSSRPPARACVCDSALSACGARGTSRHMYHLLALWRYLHVRRARAYPAHRRARPVATNSGLAAGPRRSDRRVHGGRRAAGSGRHRGQDVAPPLPRPARSHTPPPPFQSLSIGCVSLFRRFVACKSNARASQK